MPGEAELNFASKRGVGAGAGVKLAGHDPLFLRLLINRALTKSPTHGGVRANSRLLELDRGESAAADGRETQVDWRANFGATMDDWRHCARNHRTRDEDRDAIGQFRSARRPRARNAGAYSRRPRARSPRRAAEHRTDDGVIAGAFGTGHRSPPVGRGAKHRSSGPDGSLSQDAGRADPGARQLDAAQGGQDCERPEEGDRVAEDAGEPISAAASRGSDGRLRLHVAVARTRRWRRAAVTGSRRGVRQCGKARHLRQRMANTLPPPGPKSLVADFGGTGVSDCAVGNTARDTSRQTDAVSGAEELLAISAGLRSVWRSISMSPQD